MAQKRVRDNLDLIPGMRNYRVVKDPEKFARLFHLWKKFRNQETYNQLFFGNAKLVISIARKYAGRGMDMPDLVQEGIIGLMDALETFDPKKGRISTHAAWHIHGGIRRALDDKSRAIRIPSNALGKINCVRRAFYSLVNKGNKRPMAEEIYAEIRALDGTDEETATSKKIKLQDVIFCLSVMFNGVDYLEKPLSSNDERDATIGDLIADTRAKPDTRVELERLQQTIFVAIERVLEKEKKPNRTLTILRLHFELDWNLQQIADHLGLSREYIRQIVERVIKKLIIRLKRIVKITPKRLEEILKQIPLGAEEETLTSPHVNPMVVDVAELFTALCQHVLLTPSEKQIIKAPVPTLRIKNRRLSVEDAERVLREMKKQGLIKGEPPWTEIEIIPEVEIPKFTAYR